MCRLALPVVHTCLCGTPACVCLSCILCRFEWQGDWSDQSKLWTPESRARLGVNKSDDGFFWMPFHDFLNYFHLLVVCKVREVWHRQI